MELKKHQLKLKQLDFSNPRDKKEYNHAMFTDVAPTYDCLTVFLSFGQDQAWKKALMARLPDLNQPTCLDLACGTGDLTFALQKRYPRGHITGLDLNERMLALAAKRAESQTITFLKGDMNATGLESNRFDLVTGSYALRNAPDLKSTLQEIHRLLKPGGIAAFLDFSKSSGWLHKIQSALLTLWGGLWGLILHRHIDPYIYIAKSLDHFPDRRTLHRLLQSQGFRITSTKLFFFGFIEIILVAKS